MTSVVMVKVGPTLNVLNKVIEKTTKNEGRQHLKDNLPQPDHGYSAES